MAATLAFDVYGTLIDTDGLVAQLRPVVGQQAPAFSALWRQKQLEYAFRRGLMRRYRHFEDCTRDALRFACAAFGVRESAELIERLMAAYGRLPASSDAREGLERARAVGLCCYAFSNGRGDAVEAVLREAGLRDLVLGVVSVHDLRTFKPDPAVYAHFLETAGAAAEETWLVSGNGFDLLGAVNAGLNAVWLKRDPSAVADPWEIGPTLSVSSLVELPDALSGYGHPGSA